MKIQIKRKKGTEDLPLPKYATAGSSGMDLYAAVDEDVEVGSGDIKLVPTGIYILPDMDTKKVTEMVIYTGQDI